MRIVTRIIVALALSALPAVSRAQHIVTDSIKPERIVVRSALFGVTGMDILDTYLSRHQYSGYGLNLSHENFRDARTGSYRWKYQTTFNATAGFTDLNDNSSQLCGFATYTWGGYHPFSATDRLQLLAGVQMQLEGGAIYMASNGNNPVSMKLRAAIAASGMATYKFPIRQRLCTARLQLDIPVAGVMFAPEFGQSYYEIFGLGHTGGIVAFSHPFNSPSWKYALTLDIPMGGNRYSATLRLAYTGDIYQSDINDIRCHIYRHAFSIGFVKTIFKVKQENSIKAYSPY